MPRCHGNQRMPARERLQLINVERVSTKLARDFAKHTARVAVGEDILPVNHAGLRDALREAIDQQLQRAQAQA